MAIEKRMINQVSIDLAIETSKERSAEIGG